MGENGEQVFGFPAAFVVRAAARLVLLDAVMVTVSP